jgi:HAD superfamily hydrolase (TIGR01509 family)
MSKEYIDFLRKMPVYQYFDGEIISCEVGLVKPEKEIYSLLLERFCLDPAQTMFIDDRKENVVAAAELGIAPFHFDRKNPEQSCRQIRELLNNRGEH